MLFDTLKEDVVVTQLTKGYASSLFVNIGDVITKISINGVEHNIIRAHQIEDLLLTIRENDKIIITVKRSNALVELGTTNLEVSETYIEDVL